MRNRQEIAEEIQWLKDHKRQIPRADSRGENWPAIEAQIEVLLHLLTHDDLEEKLSNGEWDERQHSLAEEALAWLEGDDEFQPSAAHNWGNLLL